DDQATRPRAGDGDRRPLDSAALDRRQLRDPRRGAEPAPRARTGARRQRRISFRDRTARHRAAPPRILPAARRPPRVRRGTSAPLIGNITKVLPGLPRRAPSAAGGMGISPDPDIVASVDSEEALMTAEFFHRDIQHFIRHRVDWERYFKLRT